MASKNEIILFHYSFSPYARRVVWYLNLRGIPYTQCLQPPILPRPDTAALGTNYRRIPLLSIGRDIYNDTRLILRKLEELFPPSSRYPSISSTSPDQRAWERLLESWAVDSGMFMRASQLIPSDMPLLKDPAFVKDRGDLTGRPWEKEKIDLMRPEALVDIKGSFELLETTLLADGRDWILKTDGPSLADIEAVWPFHWLRGLRGALPSNFISSAQFPKVFAWIERFHQATDTAAKKVGKPKTIKGPEALQLIEDADFAEPQGAVDGNDPSGLRKGDEIEVWPIDTGFSRKDRGRLVRLDGSEIVVESKTKNGKEVRIHAPRHGFRVRRIGKGAKL